MIVEWKIRLKITELCGKSFIKIDCKLYLPFGLTADQELYVWGQNSNKNRPNLLQIREDIVIKDVVSSYTKLLLLSELGYVYIIEEKSDQKVVQLVKVNELDNINVVSIYSGSNNYILQSNRGLLMRWCSNESSNYNDICYLKSPKLIEISVNIKVKKCSLGDYHSLVLTDSGHVYAFGRSKSFYGHLGIIDEQIQNKDYTIKTSVKFVDVFAYDMTSMALSDNGFVYIWGQTNMGSIKSPKQTEFQDFQTAINEYSKYLITYKPLSFEELFESDTTTDSNPIVDSQSQTISKRLGILSTSFNNREYSDLMFKINDHLIYGHKCVLANIKHIKDQIDNNWSEVVSCRSSDVDSDNLSEIKSDFSDITSINSSAFGPIMIEITEYSYNSFTNYSCISFIRVLLQLKI